MIDKRALDEKGRRFLSFPAVFLVDVGQESPEVRAQRRDQLFAVAANAKNSRIGADIVERDISECEDQPDRRRRRPGAVFPLLHQDARHRLLLKTLRNPAAAKVAGQLLQDFELFGDKDVARGIVARHHVTVGIFDPQVVQVAAALDALARSPTSKKSEKRFVVRDDGDRKVLDLSARRVPIVRRPDVRRNPVARWSERQTLLCPVSLGAPGTKTEPNKFP